MLPETLARRAYAGNGAAEFDPDFLVADLCAVIDGVFERSEEIKGEITHAASCAFWHGLLGVDEKGKPTTKVLTWADTRSREYTNVLRKDFDETEVHTRTGARFHSSFWPSKLLFLRKEKPDVWKQTNCWLSFSDYVCLLLCGTPTSSVSMASATGIFDQRKCSWDVELLRYLGLNDSTVPFVVQDDSVSFGLSEEYSRRWPRLKNTRWFPAIGDGAANNLGSGCTTKDRAALMIGTSGAMRVVYDGTPPAESPSGLWSYRVDRKRVLIGGALSDGGGLYHWLKQNLRVEISDEEIAQEMTSRGADAHRLTVMPFFFGERSTGYNEHARGSIIGLNASHDAIDILQAAMEAVAFRMAEVFDQLMSVTTIKEIVISGGALENSPVWTQIMADVLGRDLLVSHRNEMSMHGAVYSASKMIDPAETRSIVSSEPSIIEFHDKCNAVYKVARQRHESLYLANTWRL